MLMPQSIILSLDLRMDGLMRVAVELSLSEYDYSPSVLNVRDLNWNQLGEEEVCRQLVQVPLDQAS